MKNKYLFIHLGLILLLGAFVVLPFCSNTDGTRSYQPRGEESTVDFSAQGAIEYLTRIRANQITKNIDAKDVIRAQEQARQLSSVKSAGQPWEFRGPDNFGGRTRAILFDNENANLMFAGGVAGGLWKSTTKGQYWEQVSYNGATVDDFANLAVVSIAQASNGDIYFGTGEALPSYSGHGTNIFTPFIMGAGIWKSSNRGQTFTKLESTWSEDKDMFAYVSKIGIDITTDKVYASTEEGLRESVDGGTTWTASKIEDSQYESKFSSDVKVASDGSVIASIDNMCFVKKAGNTEFVLKSGPDQDSVLNDETGVTGHLITNDDVGRLEFSYSKNDPNIIVCAVATTSGQLRNIYRSIDGGDNWVIIGAGGSDLFQPFGSQGIYDMCIEISAASDDEIYIAGLDVWFGKAANTGDLFAWSQASLNQLNPVNPLYVHADQHTIVFDPSDPKMFFVGSDGGMSRCYLGKDGIKYQFTSMNKNYNVTQFYSVAANSSGQVMGGTQDNGTILVYNDPDFPNKGKQLTGGDGGHVAMSSIAPSVGFSTTQFGGLYRNNDSEFVDWNTFYCPKIINVHWSGSSTYLPNPYEGSFVTPIAYYETDNDVNGTDTVEYITLRAYSNGEKVRLPSHNIHKAPIDITLDQDYEEGDTIRYRDHYGSLFAFGMARALWVTRSATNWNKTLTDDDWFRAIDKKALFYTDLKNLEIITQVTIASDGDKIFFSTNYNNLYRLAGLDTARNVDNACYQYDKGQTTVLTQIGEFENRTITGIACDPNDIDKIIVTIGNYGNSDYVYYCDVASTVEETTDMSNFVDITGNLPTAPAFCALFEKTVATGTVLVGTDMGVFKTEDVTADDVAWESYQENLGPVPTFQIKQQTKNWQWTENNGIIYIGTHGLGIYQNNSFLTGIEEDDYADGSFANTLKAKVYPNPAISDINISYELENNSSVTISVLNTAGQLLKYENVESVVGENSTLLNISDLPKGLYLIQIKAGGSEVTKQIVKQ